MSSRGIVIGNNNLIGADVEDFALINCQNMDFGIDKSGRTYINNGRHIANNFTTASASAVTYVTGSYNVYKVDCSGGDAYFEFDTVALNGCAITLLNITVGNDLIISTKSGTGLFQQAATPATVTPALLDSYTIWSDGTDLFII